MNYTEDDLLPLSGLQHLLFCERQCALIHIWSRPGPKTGAYAHCLRLDAATVVCKAVRKLMRN